MRNSKRLLLVLMGAALVALGTSCVRMTHQLEQTKPLEINVNVRLQIDRELDEFFAFQNRTPAPANGPAAPAPAPPVTQAPPEPPAPQ